MISGCDFREEILSIVAMLSSDSVLITPPSKREQAVAAHKKFVSSSGDHITLLNMYRGFSSVTSKKACAESKQLILASNKQIIFPCGGRD
jgi:ATP-dependent RNA helicase DHX33